MAQPRSNGSKGTILLIGASRGLGHAMAAEFLKKGWNVMGTVRGGGTRTLLHDLADAYPGRVEIEILDICVPDQLAALRKRLSGLRELYRGTKAALNMFMRSFAARHAGEARAMVVMAPGWVRTELGGPDARLTIEESVPSLVNVLLAQLGTPGLRYLDYLGRTVPW